MNRLTLEKASVGTTKKVIVPFADSIDVVWTNTATISAAHAADFSLSFERRTNSDLAVFALEHGGVIVWVIIGIVVLCLLCVGVIVWKKCFSNKEEFYLEDAYARV
jgi:tetrahydromethanopterin S-methyltransferase subunit C